MMRMRLGPIACLVFGALFTGIAGCGQTGDKEAEDAKPSGNAGAASGGAVSYSAEDLKGAIGEYMPPLEGGSLEIAAPRDWEWSRPDGAYLVGFHKQGSSLNNLPRILVSVEDSPFPGLSDVDRQNVDELVKLVSESVDAAKLKGSVEPMVLGETACARYVEIGRKGNARAAIQTLKTLAGGRLYTIRLEAFDAEFTKYRDTGYAVAASMKFSSPDTILEPTPEVDDDAESTEPDAASPAKDADDPPKPAASAPD